MLAPVENAPPVVSDIAAPGMVLAGKAYEPADCSLSPFQIAVEEVYGDAAGGPQGVLCGGVDGGSGIAERGLPETAFAGRHVQVALLYRERGGVRGQFAAPVSSGVIHACSHSDGRLGFEPVTVQIGNAGPGVPEGDSQVNDIAFLVEQGVAVAGFEYSPVGELDLFVRVVATSDHE